MGLQRIKGQEIFLAIVVDDKLDEKIGPFLDLDVELMKEILEGEYLGETTTHFDSVFKGCKITAKAHIRYAHYLRIIDREIRRSRYQDNALVRMDLTAVMNFPDAKLVPYTFRDVQCSTHKFTAGNRKEFVEITLEMYCSEQPAVPANVI